MQISVVAVAAIEDFENNENSPYAIIESVMRATRSTTPVSQIVALSPKNRRI